MTEFTRLIAEHSSPYSSIAAMEAFRCLRELKCQSTTHPNNMSAPTTTAVAKPRQEMAAYFKTPDFRSAVQQALPKHCSEDRFNRILLTALLKTPKLAECTRESLLEKVIQVASLGLECDGRRAHLIPFNNSKKGIMEVQLIVDYKGLVELIYRSGDVSKLHADIVCENDTFVYNKGQIEVHAIDFKRERGEPYAAYSEATMKSGMVSACVMSKFEIDFIRNSSRGKDEMPWTDHWGEMAKKTCIRRHSKLLPLSPDLREKIESDDDNFDDIKRATPSVVAPNFLTDAPAATEPEPPAPVVEAPKQTRKPKPAAVAPTPEPLKEPAPIEVESTVTPQEPPAEIEPPPTASAPVAAAPQSELDALLVTSGASWAQVARKAVDMGWFGETKLYKDEENKVLLPITVLQPVQVEWLKKNVAGICKLARRVVV